VELVFLEQGLLEDAADGIDFHVLEGNLTVINFDVGFGVRCGVAVLILDPISSSSCADDF
jgi:hypothetical protein